MKKRRRTDYGNRESHFENSTLGPQSAWELGRWPGACMDRLAAEGLLLPALRVLRHGCLATTDFSGLDAPQEGWAQLLSEVLARRGPGADVEPISWVRSCDCDEVVQATLVKKAKGCACVFKNLLDRLPQEAKSWLELHLAVFNVHEPGSQLWKEAREGIHNFIAENEQWLFPRDAVSTCLVHKQECCVHRLGDSHPHGSMDESVFVFECGRVQSGGSRSIFGQIGMRVR